MKRFINVDVLLSTGAGFLGYNMFAYCNNNPVMCYDPSGCIVTDWDRAHLDAYDLETLRLYTDRYESPWLSEEGKAYQHQLACELRAKYRMPYEVTDSSGITTVDKNKLNEFIEMAYKNNPQTNSVNGLAGVGIVLALSDSPAIGPMDIIGIVIIAVSGEIITRGSRPSDLEKGMSKYQKEKFKGEIEDFKRYNGMPPSYNLPWAILKEIAEEILERYKNK